jgi:galactokinase
MPSLHQHIEFINSGNSQGYFTELYGRSPAAIENQRRRYHSLLQQYAAAFSPDAELDIFSAPGRSEVGGNHTDHNAGRILAAAVDPDIIAAVARNDEGVVRIHSEGYRPTVMRVDELAMVAGERYTSMALTRGVLARFKQMGYNLGGFDAVATSQVPKGSGLSSSAAYEVLIAAILNDLYNDSRIDRVTLAQIGQYAENEYFGKPCGLMDQTTCAVGGFVTIDFKDFSHPVVKKVDFDFAASGYTLAIVDTKGDHADLNDEYTALEHEMKSVARALGGQVLREFSEQTVIERIGELRTKVNDRAILRAVHFYRDDQRVVDQVAALERGDFQEFLSLTNASGLSSWMLCQNCYSPKNTNLQGISIALTASEALLQGRGAWRVHGGGFAGTIQAFVPDDLLAEYIARIERIFGRESCYPILIRPQGVLRMLLG